MEKWGLLAGRTLAPFSLSTVFWARFIHALDEPRGIFLLPGGNVCFALRNSGVYNRTSQTARHRRGRDLSTTLRRVYELSQTGPRQFGSPAAPQKRPECTIK